MTSANRPARTAGIGAVFPRATVQLASGVLLTTLSWAVSWSGAAPWSYWAFFPLWLGYIITADALVRRRLGRSLMTSGALRAAGVFALSAVAWWVFEAFNLRTGNWRYLQPQPVGPVRFVLEATLDFSTVLPAIFATAVLWHHALPGGMGRWPRRALHTRSVAAWVSGGLICLVLPLIWPGIFYGLIWGCVFLILDPLNSAAGGRSLLAAAARGVRRPLLVLALAGLTCGFFWEMWNYYSMPKWVYHVPGLPQQRLFEMPLVGFIGYVPFAWECFAVYQAAAIAWTRISGRAVAFDAASPTLGLPS